MRIIVVTANKYVNLLAGFSCQFNKYWSKEHKVDVLCYKKPSFNLPPNFSVRSLGTDDRYWTNGLIEFFSSFDEDYFVLFLEDQFIVKPLKKNVFDLAVGLISSKKVDKVFLSEFQNKNTLDWGPYSEHFHIWKNSNDWKPKKTSLTPTSLIPSIWTTHAFVKFLKKNSTPWHFETQKIEKNIYEKMKVLRGISSISMCVDACRKGKFNKRLVERDGKNGVKIGGKMHYLSQSDIDVFLRSWESVKTGERNIVHL